MLTYEGKLEERERVCKFNKSINLPICLKDLDLAVEDLQAMTKKATTVTEWTCAPEEVTEEKFIKAILDCDEYVRKQKK
ncbi:hypothetical protein OSC52_08445 [Clostridium pasteurianum]|uniref:hypothetical protein n=1 Tax=Clostridium pasteurianum TaxID=1501 RepID=UPI0002A78062|nr:hypothetical protein [Clostridium pasteurianum]AOZ74972.1 hypothetical protein AQ983_07695 [Clostridium pasteurianum DSM 525 = ATCC 6013]AOZ78767.1 hypothetical protein AQ984_07685 [Clostridium pasteurianum]ELP59571.1 hypothetical protein F502_06893 [Clostridium pasteurianum DSM 525 = ATCC 6013]UZW15835.1 hypothetical protein OSC52_08445 [Clostridium pasteurianum]